MISVIAKRRWPDVDSALSCLRKIGKRPKTSMEKRVKENTWVVEGSRDARTAEAIMAEFVDIEAGSLHKSINASVRIRKRIENIPRS